ncbi:MAG: transpeptidase family protein [Bdellovibrionales bacterium]|nr:transpeptidase family protein [Bdellovibrionales bacterium]
MDKNFRLRLGLAFLAVVLLGTGVFVRAAWLMLVPSPRMEAALDRQFRSEAPKIPRRGYILDRNGEPIAISVKVRSLFANPGKIEHKGEAAYLLSRALPALSSNQIREKLLGKKSFVWLRRHLTEEETASVEQLLRRKPVLGIGLGLVDETKRSYPDGNLAAQIIGFTGLDNRGLEGVELGYNTVLAGRVDEGGVVHDGKNILLTIDKFLQHTLEAELREGMKNSSAAGAAGLILDADTGDILAMASVPGYDLNDYRQAPPEHRRNRVVTDTYEPGSTMKPLMVAGALQLGAIKPDARVFCENGKFQIGKHQVNEAESKDKWGWLTVGQVLQKSSNIGATKIGFLFGSGNLWTWYKTMGITEKTGIAFPGEVAGVLPDWKGWSKIHLSNISFGQGMSVTPLQVARAYAAIANGGYLVRPRIVRQLNSFEGEVEEILPVTPPVKALEPSVVSAVQKMISRVATEEGTAPKAAIPGFTVVGKTGTAQKAYPGIGYRSGKHIGSFVGFVQDIRPRYVTVITVDEPKFPYFGGETAAPIFQRVMSLALARVGAGAAQPILLTRENKIERKERALARPKARDGRALASGGARPAPVFRMSEAGAGEMPDLVGASAKEVLEAFHRKDLQVRMRGAGTVVEQFPPPGAALQKGDQVSLRLSHGEEIP